MCFGKKETEIPEFGDNVVTKGRYAVGEGIYLGLDI
jgi:hypothetical protein